MACTSYFVKAEGRRRGAGTRNPDETSETEQRMYGYTSTVSQITQIRSVATPFFIYHLSFRLLAPLRLLLCHALGFVSIPVPSSVPSRSPSAPSGVSITSSRHALGLARHPHVLQRVSCSQQLPCHIRAGADRAQRWTTPSMIS